MLNRSEIMKAAWAQYRTIRARYEPWQIERGIIDGSFAAALRFAWRVAKAAADRAVKEFRLATGPNAARAASIRQQIEMLSYKSLRYDIEPMRRALVAELDALAN